MSAITESAPQATELPLEPHQMEQQARQATWEEAQQLLAEGKPELAMAKKAEAIGLQPLEGRFTSMAAQPIYKRKDLHDLGVPLVDGTARARSLQVTAVAALYPKSSNPEQLLAATKNAANQLPNEGIQPAINQAKKALDGIYAKRQELQAEKAFTEVGVFTANSGFIAARGGNGDLLVGKYTPENLKALEAAGYRDGEGDITLFVPFSSNEASRQDVKWVQGTGAGPVPDSLLNNL
ncbi:MAG: hypothetical protein JWL89_515 [Candidatus Saccharibacteria bacterium]|nr:hypothetical protein [Candidatus Saccharibacteria bacterium]